MANPALVSCVADIWTCVASGVTAGSIYNMSPTVSFMQTYRMNDDDAPSSDTDAVPAFLDPYAPLSISSAAGIDVYLKAIGVAGSVRVDV